MASSYKVDTGFNQQPTVADVSPQPARRVPLSHGAINYAGGGRSYPNGGLKTTLTWNAGLERSEYASIQTQFGLSLTVTSAEVTIRMDDDTDAVTYYNAIACYSQDSDRGMTWWGGLEIELHEMEEVAAP